MNLFYKSVLLFTALSVSCTIFAQNTAKVTVKNEDNINSVELEFSPTFLEDGIVFISTNPAGLNKITDEEIKLNTMSMLRSRRNAEGQLAMPEPFARELSSQYHEGPLCFSPSGEEVYFSQNTLIAGKEKIASDGKQKMRLYSATKSGEMWGTPTDLGFNNGEFNDCHPSITIEGDRLYFASNRPGGYGKMDIWVSYRIGAIWGEPINLGPEVNSAENEVFPFIHADNSLYFASNRSGGSGGLDLYQTKLAMGKWSQPTNLPAPFNTNGDDFGLIVDLNKINGYFSSNGQVNGKGQDDIWSFSTENGSLDDLINAIKPSDDNNDLMVTVTDNSNGRAIVGADVRILNLEMGDVIGRDEEGNLITVQKVDGQDVLKAVPPHAGLSGQSDKKGRYGTTLREGEYSVTVSYEGFQTKQVTFATGTNNKLAIALDPVSDKVLWNATVFNYLTNAPLAGGTAVVINRGNGQRDTILTDENGRIQYYLEPNSRYSAELYQGGRLIGTTDIESGAGGRPLQQNISVAPLLPGTVVELPNIYYNYGDASLRPDARKDLDIVVALMKQHREMTVELSSHTDSRGRSPFNQQLSQKRANGVVEYLVTKGISRNRLLPVGYGESRPRNNCTDGVTCEENDHARNRRTEIKMMTGVEGSSMVYVNGKLSGPSDDPQPITTAPASDPQSNPNRVAPLNVTTNGATEYYVIAGSFVEEVRAQRQLQTVINAGCPDAQIVRFEGSNYFSVCANRFENRNEAEQLERRLEKKNKIDAFVRAISR
jgi:outer membrane protein OmpA-like peptidoglycan-associated protein